MPSAARHWSPDWEGGGGGAPSQKTCRPPRRPSNPSRKGGFVSKLVLIVLAAFLVAVSGAAGAHSAFPQRIVSLSPSATESLFAIGAGPQVVAVDDQSDYPKTAPRTKLSGYTPNGEAIADYRPDLVVFSNDIKGVVAALKKLRIPVLLQPAVATLTGTYAEIRQLGKM